MKSKPARHILIAGIVAATMSAAGAAQALTPLLSVDLTTGVSLGNGPFTLGWDFTANSSVTVNALGVFDSSQDGLVESHDVGLWDSVGNLLASTTLGSGLSGTLINQFRYNNVTPVTLTAGQTYFIGAVWLDGSDPNVFPPNDQFPTITTDPRISYLQSTYIEGGTLTDPTSTFTPGGYFGPNLASGVPEPATWALMLLGFAGIGFTTYRRAKKINADLATI